MLVSKCAAPRKRRSLLFLPYGTRAEGVRCAALLSMKLLWICRETPLFRFKSGLWKRFVAASCIRMKGDVK
jgi:hypothetical protein